MMNTSHNKDSLLQQFVAASGRPKRELFKQLRPLLTAEDLDAIASALQDPSPKLCARVTSVLARAGRKDLFEAQMPGLKPGKVKVLSQQFHRISKQNSQ